MKRPPRPSRPEQDKEEEKELYIPTEDTISEEVESSHSDFEESLYEDDANEGRQGSESSDLDDLLSGLDDDHDPLPLVDMEMDRSSRASDSDSEDSISMDTEDEEFLMLQPGVVGKRHRRRGGYRGNRKTPEAVRRVLDQAREFYIEGKDQDALKNLHQVASQAPWETRAYELLGLLYKKQGDQRRAALSYMMAAHQSKSVDHWREASALFDATGDVRHRRSCLRKVVRLTAHEKAAELRGEYERLGVEDPNFQKFFRGSGPIRYFDLGLHFCLRRNLSFWQKSAEDNTKEFEPLVHCSLDELTERCVTDPYSETRREYWRAILSLPIKEQRRIHILELEAITGDVMSCSQLSDSYLISEELRTPAAWLRILSVLDPSDTGILVRFAVVYYRCYFQIDPSFQAVSEAGWDRDVIEVLRGDGVKIVENESRSHRDLPQLIKNATLPELIRAPSLDDTNARKGVTMLIDSMIDLHNTCSEPQEGHPLKPYYKLPAAQKHNAINLPQRRDVEPAAPGVPKDWDVISLMWELLNRASNHRGSVRLGLMLSDNVWSDVPLPGLIRLASAKCYSSIVSQSQQDEKAALDPLTFVALASLIKAFKVAKSCTTPDYFSLPLIMWLTGEFADALGNGGNNHLSFMTHLLLLLMAEVARDTNDVENPLVMAQRQRYDVLLPPRLDLGYVAAHWVRCYQSLCRQRLQNNTGSQTIANCLVEGIPDFVNQKIKAGDETFLDIEACESVIKVKEDDFCLLPLMHLFVYAFARSTLLAWTYGEEQRDLNMFFQVKLAALPGAASTGVGGRTTMPSSATMDTRRLIAARLLSLGCALEGMGRSGNNSTDNFRLATSKADRQMLLAFLEDKTELGPGEWPPPQFPREFITVLPALENTMTHFGSITVKYGREIVESLKYADLPPPLKGLLVPESLFVHEPSELDNIEATELHTKCWAEIPALFDSPLTDLPAVSSQYLDTEFLSSATVSVTPAAQSLPVARRLWHHWVTAFMALVRELQWDRDRAEINLKQGRLAEQLANSEINEIALLNETGTNDPADFEQKLYVENQRQRYKKSERTGLQATSARGRLQHLSQSHRVVRQDGKFYGGTYVFGSWAVYRCFLLYGLRKMFLLGYHYSALDILDELYIQVRSERRDLQMIDRLELVHGLNDLALRISLGDSSLYRRALARLRAETHSALFDNAPAHVWRSTILPLGSEAQVDLISKILFGPRGLQAVFLSSGPGTGNIPSWANPGLTATTSRTSGGRVFDRFTGIETSGVSFRETWTENRSWFTRSMISIPNSVALMLAAVHYSNISQRTRFCVPLLHRLSAIAPLHTTIALFTAVSWISIATSRSLHQRHPAVIRGLAALKDVVKLRTSLSHKRFMYRGMAFAWRRLQLLHILSRMDNSIGEQRIAPSHLKWTSDGNVALSQEEFHTGSMSTTLETYGLFQAGSCSKTSCAIYHAAIVLPLWLRMVRTWGSDGATLRCLELIRKSIEISCKMESSYLWGRGTHHLGLHHVAFNAYSSVLSADDQPKPIGLCRKLIRDLKSAEDGDSWNHDVSDSIEVMPLAQILFQFGNFERSPSDFVDSEALARSTDTLLEMIDSFGSQPMLELSVKLLESALEAAGEGRMDGVRALGDLVGRCAPCKCAIGSGRPVINVTLNSMTHKSMNTFTERDGYVDPDTNCLKKSGILSLDPDRDCWSCHMMKSSKLSRGSFEIRIKRHTDDEETEIPLWHGSSESPYIQAVRERQHFVCLSAMNAASISSMSNEHPLEVGGPWGSTTGFLYPAVWHPEGGFPVEPSGGVGRELLKNHQIKLPLHIHGVTRQTIHMTVVQPEIIEFILEEPLSNGVSPDTIEDVAIIKSINFVNCSSASAQPVFVVTSGGTSIPLDRAGIRTVENFSTGSRGKKLVDGLLELGYRRVIHVARDSTLVANISRSDLIVRFKSYFDYVYATHSITTFLLSKEGLGHVIFVSAAAVSDFYIPFDQLSNNKGSSRSGPITLTLQPAPKVLRSICNLPDTFDRPVATLSVVGFKLELNLHDLHLTVSRQFEECGSRLVASVGNLFEKQKDEVLIFTRRGGDMQTVEMSPSTLVKSLLAILLRDPDDRQYSPMGAQ